LSKVAAGAIRRAARRGELAIASITLWELAALFSAGRLRGSGTVEASIRAIVDSARVAVLEVTVEIAALSVQWPDTVPADPADRLIVGTAAQHAIALVTRDARLRQSGGCRTIW
jgi:PIN domain nuclease of toxin-antitoxin system